MQLSWITVRIIDFTQIGSAVPTRLSIAQREDFPRLEGSVPATPIKSKGWLKRDNYLRNSLITYNFSRPSSGTKVDA